MINANEAKAIIENVKKQEQEALGKKIIKFLDEECDTAIKNAASQKIPSVLVELTQELDPYTANICNHLASFGYKTQVRFGMRNAILIMR